MTFVSSEPPKRTLPTPFERPKIDISAAGRSWQWVLPEQLKENDIVPDFGLIKHLEHYLLQDSLEEIVKVVGAGKSDKFPRNKKIFAFTRKPT